jgi:hypothetical protein
METGYGASSIGRGLRLVVLRPRPRYANVDALEDRALFTRTPEARDYNAEERDARIARRKARWCPTTLIDWPAPIAG